MKNASFFCLGNVLQKVPWNLKKKGITAFFSTEFRVVRRRPATSLFGPFACGILPF